MLAVTVEDAQFKNVITGGGVRHVVQEIGILVDGFELGIFGANVGVTFHTKKSSTTMILRDFCGVEIGPRETIK